MDSSPVEHYEGSFIAITGATGGLGKAFAVVCASQGYAVFLTDLSGPALERLAGGLRRNYGVQVVTYACDLTDPAGRDHLFNFLQRQSLRLWGLINVAGTDFEGPFCEQSSQQIRTIIRLNIEATLDTTLALWRCRDLFHPFHIINVASLAALTPMPHKATYAASKRFLVDFSLALREELRPLGATVTVLCPAGLPTTPGCLQAIAAQGWPGRVTTQNISQVANQTLQAALAGKAIVIPGAANRLAATLRVFIPTTWLVGLVGRRWKSARRKSGAERRPGFRPVTAAEPGR